MHSLRRFALLASLSLVACAAESSATNDATRTESDAITRVRFSPVKNQTIGNCWVYATIGWAESLHKRADNRAVDFSESYLTYWSWFEEIVTGSGTAKEIDGGGDWTTGIALMSRYGLMNEADFIPEEAGARESARQASALEAVNAALKSGALRDAAARRDRTAVRGVLDAAFGLRPAMVDALDTTFGRDVQRILNRNGAATAGNILRTSDVSAKLQDAPGAHLVAGTLADAIGTGRWTDWRQGEHAWNWAAVPATPAARRRFEKRVQNALNDHQPVVIGWWVDFNALTPDSALQLAPLTTAGPGSQGGHMTLLYDYQADVPGVGLLRAGDTATAEQKAAALSDDTRVVFWRSKNSWGLDPHSRIHPSGYYDLYSEYMYGPIRLCDQTPEETSDLAHCVPTTPWTDVVLPAGY